METWIGNPLSATKGLPAKTKAAQKIQLKNQRIFLDGTIDTIEIDARDTKKAGVDFEADAAGKTWEYGEDDDTKTLAIVNEWYTYTVDKDGVYTLRNVASQDAVNTNKLEINAANIDIPVSGSKHVFGNNDTVYINATLANISTVVTGNTRSTVSVIDDVESVTTGIRNVDIEVKGIGANTADDKETAAYYPYNEVYPLWDKDNWLIGVVVVGEDQGISSDYAFVHTSGVSQETYTDEDSNHHWFRDVLIDGKVTELEYVDDSSINVLNSTDMKQGEWVRVYYNADGTVRRVEKVSPVYDFVPTLIGNGVDGTEVYSQKLENNGDTKKDELYYENGSLYVITDGDRTGFSIRPDVKVAYINAKTGTDKYDEVVDGLEGIDGLRTALKRVNNNFTGSINVIFDDNSAAVIVLNNWADDPGYNGGNDAQGNYLTLKMGTKTGTGIARVEINGVSYTIGDDSTKNPTIKVKAGEPVEVKVVAVGASFSPDATVVSVNPAVVGGEAGTALRGTEAGTWTLVQVVDNNTIVIEPKA